MKIVFTSDGNQGLESRLAQHFGHCAYYVFVEIEGDKVISVQTKRNPFFNQHAPGEVPKYIADEGADVIISGGMGPAAIEWFKQLGVTPITTEPREIALVLKDFIDGKLAGAEGCS